MPRMCEVRGLEYWPSGGVSNMITTNMSFQAEIFHSFKLEPTDESPKSKLRHKRILRWAEMPIVVVWPAAPSGISPSTHSFCLWIRLPLVSWASSTPHSVDSVPDRWD
jgi:hypothetical protein